MYVLLWVQVNHVNGNETQSSFHVNKNKTKIIKKRAKVKSLKTKLDDSIGINWHVDDDGSERRSCVGSSETWGTWLKDYCSWLWLDLRSIMHTTAWLANKITNQYFYHFISFILVLNNKCVVRTRASVWSL